MVVFGEFDWHVVVVFQCNIQDDVQNGSNNRVGNHMVYVMIHCTEKITAFYFFVMVMIFAFVLVFVSINPCSTFEATFGQI